MKNIQLKSIIWAGLSSLTLIATEAGANQHSNLAEPLKLSVTSIASSNNSSWLGSSCLNSLFACSINLNDTTVTSQTLTVTSTNDPSVTIATLSTSDISSYVTITFPGDPTATTASCHVPCTVTFTQTNPGLVSAIYFIGTSSNGTRSQTANIPITTINSTIAKQKKG